MVVYHCKSDKLEKPVDWITMTSRQVKREKEEILKNDTQKERSSLK